MDGTLNISMATSILIVYAAYLLLLVLPTDVLQRDAIRASHNCIPLVIVKSTCTNNSNNVWIPMPRAGSGVVRMDPLHFLAGCHTWRLNQA